MKEEVSPARMKVVKEMVSLMADDKLSRINDMWIWIFESNENQFDGGEKDMAAILTDPEITEFMRLATGKRSQVFEHVSMVRARLHRGLLFTKGGRDSFDPGMSGTFDRDEQGNVTRRDSRTRTRSIQMSH